MLAPYLKNLETAIPSRIVGQVTGSQGTTIEVADLPVAVGSAVAIERTTGGPLEGEVIGFRNRLAIVFPIGEMIGIRPGNRVQLTAAIRTIRVGDELLGRVLDAQGRCIDEGGQPLLRESRRIDGAAPSAVSGPPIDRPLCTGIRAIDSLLTCGRGQRMGIFAGSGVGKSMLLGMMARATEADVIVIALVGERGREVNEFIQRDLGPEGRPKSVVVVSTSDEPAIMRVQAARAATTIAEYFRDQGKDVLLIVDSLSRLAAAQREIGLAAGEPPATRGYPPSVFSLLPKLVERAGRLEHGSITAFYSVLVDGDDPNEPIADAVRGLLDGHTWLSRELAGRGHYPAIDVLESISRLMNRVTSGPWQSCARTLRELLAALRENQDLISIGAYRKGTNRTVDVAIDARQQLDQFLQQQPHDLSTLARAEQDLMALAQPLAAQLRMPLTMTPTVPSTPVGQ